MILQLIDHLFFEEFNEKYVISYLDPTFYCRFFKSEDSLELNLCNRRLLQKSRWQNWGIMCDFPILYY